MESGRTLESGFEKRWGSFHYGLDFGWPGGSDGKKIYAAQAGTVQYIGAAKGFGQWIVIDHDDSQGSGCTVYGHMWDAFATGLSVGSKVVAGQHIGYVGANGEVTGPHLHFEVHPRGWSAGSQIDPLPWLAGALEPGQEAPVVTPTDARLFGVDIASWQAGINLRQVANEGFRYVLAKATQGNNYTNPEYAAQKRGSLDNGMHFAAYHYIESAVSATSQVDRFERVEPDRNIPVMLDHEHGSGGIDVLRNVHAEFVSRGYRVILIYIPKWYWSGSAGSADLSGLPPLMSSDYGRERAGIASLIYPGDDNIGWAGYGGNRVAVFQFTQKASVAGMAIDASAFKGSEADLTLLFTGSLQEAIMSAADHELTQELPSRSKYRASDDPVDTLAGMVLNIDARIHEQFVEREAEKGVPEYVALVKREADKGDLGAKAVLDGLK